MKRLVIFIFVALAMGCTDGRKAGTPTQLTDSDDVADQALMVALAQAKNFHHEAKVFMSDGNLDAAIAAVRRVLSVQFPAGAAEADDVRLDARALLGKLLVAQGKLDDAMTIVNEGIASATRESFFVANLYTVQGEIHTAMARHLDGDSDTATPAGAAERHAAIESFDHSIKINETIQRRLSAEPMP